MRPTGRLHLGHLVGALGNWVPLQDKYDCFYFVADWHALTSDFADTSQLTAFTQATGLHMGQWLSMPMIFGGLYLMLTARRRRQRVEPIAGTASVA